MGDAVKGGMHGECSRDSVDIGIKPNPHGVGGWEGGGQRDR